MNIGFDIGSELFSKQTGIGRYIASLAEWLPQVEPDAALRIFADRRPDQLSAADKALLADNFGPMTVELCSGRVPVLRPSEFNSVRKLHLQVLFRLLDGLSVGIEQGINRAESPWSRAIKRSRCPPGPEEVDLMHVMRLPSYPWLRSRIVTTIYDVIPLTSPEWAVLSHIRDTEIMVTFAKQRCDAVIAVSAFTRREIIRVCGLAPERVVAIPIAHAPSYHPRDIECQRRARDAAGVGKRPFILFVAALEPRKNLAALLRAYECIRGKMPHALVVVGSYRHGPRPALNASGIFHLPKANDETLSGLMSAATVFVLPSLAEGFGLPVLEAMACGCPVIAGNVTSLPEVAGDAAVLVNPRDDDALFEAIRSVLENDALRAQLRRKGLERAGQFSWKRNAQETVAVYRQVCNC